MDPTCPYSPSFAQLGIEVINEMAMQTVMLNIDRCTKNFVTYLNPDSLQWTRFPWDLESAFGIDRPLGEASIIAHPTIDLL